MKKLLCFLISIILVISLVSCGNSGAGINDPISSYDGIVKDAIGALKTEWKDIYSKYDTDGHFEIKNTRVIEIKDNDISIFKDVKYVVEFILYTDYYGAAPYYYDIGTSDVVIIYKDGKIEVTGDIFNRYSKSVYSYDYTDIIENIADCGAKYNLVEKIK